LTGLGHGKAYGQQDRQRKGYVMHGPDQS
jgi:hypothetical protein